MGDAANSTHLLTKQSHWVKMAHMRNYHVLWGLMPKIARIYSVYAGQEWHPVIYSSHYTWNCQETVNLCFKGHLMKQSLTADIIY